MIIRVSNSFVVGACAVGLAVVAGSLVTAQPTKDAKPAAPTKAPASQPTKDGQPEMQLPPGSPTCAVIPVLDLTVPDEHALRTAARAIDRLRAEGPVLVCCALGVSRSACAVTAWLVQSGRAKDVNDALARVRSARPEVVLGGRHAAALALLAQSSPIPTRS